MEPVGGLPRLGFPRTVAVAAQPINKKYGINLEQARQGETRTSNASVSVNIFPYPYSAIPVAILSSLLILQLTSRA
jgi:hypothetical protein